MTYPGRAVRLIIRAQREREAARGNVAVCKDKVLVICNLL
jgi:hypothetical protein